jgi:hypothetical protein
MTTNVRLLIVYREKPDSKLRYIGPFASQTYVDRCLAKLPPGHFSAVKLLEQWQ